MKRKKDEEHLKKLFHFLDCNIAGHNSPSIEEFDYDKDWGFSNFTEYFEEDFEIEI
ncbi:hypothetical protein [Pseudotamlana haliotis]|uniref:hypothetical protein n=1 Tax=Pseudotamlana haliotis TaxID=2614804 RepID=UPI0017808657|nr:hypothetical protein [Tamlana haliotis]